MNLCERCKTAISDGDEMKYNSKIFCEDCYIDIFFEKAKKTYYLECDHSFMKRLKPGFDNRRLFEE